MGLHEFDLGLSEYVRGTIGGHMMPGRRGGGAFAAWSTQSLTSQILAHLRGSRDPHVELLLSGTELRELELAFDCMSLDLWRPWVPWEPLHHRYMECLLEIRSSLSSTTAEEFARTSVEYARRLENESLELVAGIRVVAEWVEDVRNLKRAMGQSDLLPRPEGSVDTPSDRRKSDEGKTAPAARERGQMRKELNSPDDDVLTPSGAGQVLGVSPKQVTRLIHAGALSAVNVGNGSQKPRYRVARSALKNFMEGGTLVRPTVEPIKARGSNLPDLASLVDHFA